MNFSGSKTPFAIAFSGTGLTRLENWRLTWFGTTENTADPYHAGIQNVAISGLVGSNQDPQAVSMSQLPRLHMSGGNLIYDPLVKYEEKTGAAGF